MLFFPKFKIYFDFLFESKFSGTALINAVLNAEFHIESTNERVGTIRIDSSIIIKITGQGNRISAHANISRLNLQDVGNQLGLPQDALDNLGTLGKDILLKVFKKTFFSFLFFISSPMNFLGSQRRFGEGH